MTARLCCATVLSLSLAAYAPTAAHAELILTISPGPAASQTTWTFSGSTPTEFGIVRTSNPGENEPAGMWGDFPNFTILDGSPITPVSGSASYTWTHAGSVTAAGTYTRELVRAWVDDGSDNTNPPHPNGVPVTGDRIGVIVASGSPNITPREGDTLAWSGSWVMPFDISYFDDGGLGYSADSTRLYLEPNNIPMTLRIVPEPSTCLLSVASLALLAFRRSRR